MDVDPERLKRWRLILGKSTEEQLRGLGGMDSLLSESELGMDEALEALYPCADDSGSEIDKGAWEKKHIGKKGWGKASAGKSAPKVAKWLGEVRSFFPSDVVVLLQQDAIERRGMKELLLEPEVMANIEPSLDLAASILEMQSMVPEQAKQQARAIVRAAVEEVRKVLESEFVQAIRGALNRNRHSPFRSLPNLDFPRTIRKNMKHYSRELKTIIPQDISFFSRQQRQSEWNIIIAMDQSGSMHNSLIYGGVMGAILASIPTVETHVVAFNHTEVVDLTELCADPVDLLFGIQLGGAEDYWMATCYCERFMHTPAKTLYIVLGDLHDTSPNEARFVRKMEAVLESGVKAIGLLAISDQGQPAFNRDLAAKLVRMGMPCFGCTPNKLPELIGTVLRGNDLKKFAQDVRLTAE